MDTCTASVYEASEISHIFVFWWSLVSPYSALSLVRQWIHELRLFTAVWDFTDFLSEGGLGPCGGRCPGGQVEQFHGCSL